MEWRLPGNRFVVEELDLNLLAGYRHANHGTSKFTGRRLRMFAVKGTKCVSCDRVGTRLLRIHVRAMRTDGRLLSEHIDVYTEDYVLMTVDHIVPRSRGGSNCMHNLQPMCSPCNSRKADKPVSNEELRERMMA